VLFSTVNAQVIINSTNIVYVGDTIILSSSKDTTRNPTINVSNQTWDFSNLVEDTARVWNVVSPASTPYATTFGSSTMALKNGNVYQFLKADNNALSVNGTVIKSPFTTGNVVINFSNPEKIMQFPASLNGSFSTQGDYSFTIDTNASFPYAVGGFPITVTIDKIKISGHRIHVIKYDAAGVLITPVDTNNSLRMKDYYIQTDSIYANVISPFALGYIALPSNTIPGVSNPIIDTTVSYSWYTDIIGYQLLSFDYDSIHNKSSNINWLKYLTKLPSTSGIFKNTISNTTIYPNPNNGKVSIANMDDAIKTMRIYACDGKHIKDVSVVSGTTNYDLDIVQSGLYYVDLINSKNESIKKEKLIIIGNK
jgi:hypothetical protein